MKFDMHTHTREGSIDAKAKLQEIAQELKKKGFGGMLVTDHNSYRGFSHWEKLSSIPEELRDFVVLKGIEYDTRDAGHILVILPDDIYCKLLEIRGMTVKRLEKVVHELGGVLGPAHPYGTGFFALMNNWKIKRNKDVIPKFDFIETFNSCTDMIANRKAEKLAKKYKKPQFAGSDAHHLRNLGTAFVNFKENIKCNNDLIRVIRENGEFWAGGIPEEVEENHTNVIVKWLGIIGYWFYNQTGALWYSFSRIWHAEKHKHWIMRNKDKKVA